MPISPELSYRLGDGRRWIVFVFGVTTLICGISATIQADLGVGSWQVLETGLTETTGLPFAVVAIAESLAALVLAWVWLRQPPWIATAVLGCAGIGIGILLDVLTTPTTVAGQAAMLAVGIVALTVGLACYLAADLGASAQDALFVGLYEKYRLRPSRVRLLLDGSLVVGGALLGGQFGAGTAAVTVAVPALIDPALRVAHRVARTEPPVALRRTDPDSSPAVTGQTGERPLRTRRR